MIIKKVQAILFKSRRYTLLLLLIFFYLISNSQWQECGINDSFAPSKGTIADICKDRKGNIYAIGNFVTKDTSFRIYVAKWNGFSWSELGKFNNINKEDRILCICSDHLDNIYAAVYGFDSSYVSKWDGTSWKKLGDLSIKHALMYDICADLYGNVYVSTSFSLSNNADYIHTIKKWNGIAWSEIIERSNSFANSFINAIDVDSQGNLYAGGSFQKGNWEKYIVRWDGTSWKELGEGVNKLNANLVINKIQVLNKDEVYASGTFTDSSGKYYIAKWDGKRWSQVGPGSQIYGAVSSDISFSVGKNHNIYATGFYHSNPEKRVMKLELMDWVDLGHGYHKIKNLANSNSMLIDDSLKYLYLSVSYLDPINTSILYRYPICNSQSRINKSLCLSDLPYTWFNKVFSENRLTDTIIRKNIDGCDSLVLLKINVVKYSDSIPIRKGDTLLAPNGDSYQWIDCDLNININGETSQKFVIKKSGKYAVRMGLNNCFMSTKCSSQILNSSSTSNKENGRVSIFYNPKLSYILISNMIDSDRKNDWKINLLNILGQKVPVTIESTTEGFQIDIDNLANGIYFLRVQEHNELLVNYKVLIYKQ